MQEMRSGAWIRWSFCWSRLKRRRRGCCFVRSYRLQLAAMEAMENRDPILTRARMRPRGRCARRRRRRSADAAITRRSGSIFGRCAKGSDSFCCATRRGARATQAFCSRAKRKYHPVTQVSLIPIGTFCDILPPNLLILLPSQYRRTRARFAFAFVFMCHQYHYNIVLSDSRGALNPVAVPIACRMGWPEHRFLRICVHRGRVTLKGRP